MITVGLTGGIATGKSLVSQLLEEHGAFVINADLIAHDLYNPGTIGFNSLISHFGDTILDLNGTIDRKKLASIVFTRKHEMDNLNTIMHPLIYDEIKRIMSDLSNEKHPIVVVEAAVLIEAGWQDLFDQIWVVSSDVETVISRLNARNGLSREESLKRIDSQMPSKDRNKYADIVIENNGNKEILSSTIKELWADKLSTTIRR
ncbi:MAG: dephospho-CoA kinase [Chloroflexi bacterium]|nr:dephospho-CoA kinase [Chloroflexota bacterium]|tara:strand:- start:3711 stop:4319 length:609 start_codon:yes stop_codon:yes gene_type:complete